MLAAAAAAARPSLARHCIARSVVALKQITPAASISDFASGGPSGVAKEFTSFTIDQNNWAKTPTSPFAESLRAGEETRKIDMAPHPRRRFIPGELYQPEDLNDKNVPRFLKRASSKTSTKSSSSAATERRNPLKEYKDTVFLSSYLTQMGNMRSKSETGFSLMPFTYNMYSSPRK
ncbi:hypothetical protein HDU87_006403 [Geranomyces variabilis]|uniref:Uncharacterized protein n=1 Tax=Geranomyces variabilis TaxID=109894 RepID=A0AAD5THS2_9FUNG|nr:hypothetical protein HDU87_006403 [Geranomyces variabilis]